jgi:ribose transport system ATP-binding protein
VALQDVDLVGKAGSIHAITGENGAQIDVDETARRGSPTRRRRNSDERASDVAARSGGSARSGISTVFQELTVLPNLTVAENLLLGRERSRAGLLDARAC